MYMCIYIYIHTYIYSPLNFFLTRIEIIERVMINMYKGITQDQGILYFYLGSLHSAKGGAVETGCSDLYDVIY